MTVILIGPPLGRVAREPTTPTGTTGRSPLLRLLPGGISAASPNTSTVVEDVAPEEGMRRPAEPTYAQAMREAQETLDCELSSRDYGTSSPSR